MSSSPSAEECADDRARLQRYDEESRSAPGLRGTAAHAASAVEDERDFQRQPDHVEALQRPGDEEGGEAVGQHESPARAGCEHRGDEQHARVSEHVAEFREYRHDERGEQELCRLEPVEVRVADMEVFDEVADQRHGVTLQDAADDLDQEHRFPIRPNVIAPAVDRTVVMLGYYWPSARLAAASVKP
jgi:hypothetical protein